MSEKPRSRTSARVASETRIGTRTLGHRAPGEPPLARAYAPANARGGVRHGRPRVPGLPDRAPRARAPRSRRGRASRSRPAGSAAVTSICSRTTPGPRPPWRPSGPSPSCSATRRPGGSSRPAPTAPLPSGREWSSTPASRASPGGSTRRAPTARAGWTSSCLNLDSRIVSSGRSLGYTMDLGGGWAESVLAHESMLHPMPDAIEDRGASLYEPVSIACHGLMRAMPVDGEPVLIVGAGIIGLGLPRRAARALPRLSGHGPGPPPAPGRGGPGLRGGPRRRTPIRTTATGRSWRR